MNWKSRLVVSWAFVSLLCGSVFGGWPTNVKMATPLNITIAQAEAIVVASVSSFSPDPGTATARAEKVPDPQDVETEVQKLSFKPAGQYNFNVSHVIKGKCGDSVQIHLGRLSAFYYARCSFDLPTNSSVILFLKKASNGEWVSTDEVLPLIPLSLSDVSTTQLSAQAKEQDAIDYLLFSLKDDKLKPVLVSLVSSIKDKRVASAMRPLADDKNMNIRVSALKCLALNGDIAAIPKIASTTAELEKEFGATGLVGALVEYKDPKAVPFLNPLIVDGSDFLRMNAMMALRPIADKSSVPYLIKALDKDNAQHTIAYDAYYALHRIIGESLPPLVTVPQFYQHKDAEIQTLKQWWEWEQVKQNKAAATSQVASAPK